MEDNSARHLRSFSSVKSKGKWGIMNSKGEWLVQPTYDAVNVL
ncbi:MAG: WG repeat-containing protein [Veillonella parvula]